jgi:hypothetical protein
VSTLANQIPLGPAIQGFRAAIQPLLFFYLVIYFCKSERMYKRLLLILVLSSFLQIPFAVLQFLRDPTNPDAVYGTLGRGFSNVFGYFQSLTIYVLLGLGIFARKKRYLLGALVLLPSIVLASSRSTYFFLPLSLLILFRKQIMRNFHTLFSNVSKIALVMLLVLLAIYGTTRALPVRPGEGTHWPSLKELWTAQWNPEDSTGRLAWIKITAKVVREESSLLIGLGPLMWGSKPASQQYSPIFSATTENLYTSVVPSQAIVVLGEYGIVMLGVFYAMFFRLWKYSTRFDSYPLDSFWRSMCFALQGGLLVLALGGLIQRTWFTQAIAYYVWLIAGGVYLYETKFSFQRPGTKQASCHSPSEAQSARIALNPGLDGSYCNDTGEE